MTDFEPVLRYTPFPDSVLGYVAALRNHSAVLHVNSGLPVVICPDDPGIWKRAFSHEFYEAFMAWGLDSKSLKLLVMNSLVHSAMDQKEKARGLEYWR